MKISKTLKQRPRAVTYSRVSTETQKDDGFSLPYQYSALKEFCHLKEFEHIEHYEDDHSAKDFNRPAFQRFLSDVKSKKIKVDVFVCVRPDRFSRNLTCTLEMLAEFKRLNIQLITVENHTELDSPESYLPFIIHNLLPQIENERRGLNTKQGMRQALKEGRWMWKAPIGYSNNKQTKEVTINPEMGPFILRAFKEMATGLYSSDEVRKRLIADGFKACVKQSFLDVLRNPFYYGYIFIPAWKDEADQLVRGIHEPIIDEELFNEVQNVLDGKKKNFPSKITQNENLPLRGHLICKKCKGNLTGSGSANRTKIKYYYYHCQKECAERFPADNANMLFEEYLSSFEIPDNVLSLYNQILQDVFMQDDIEKQQKIKEIDKKIEIIKQRQISLSDKHLDQLISVQDYNNTKARLDKEETDHICYRTELAMDMSSFKRYFDYGMAFLYNMKDYYKKAPLDVKGKIVGSIFSEKLIFEDKKYRTANPNELLKLLTSNINGFEKLGNKKADKNVGSSTLAPLPNEILNRLSQDLAKTHAMSELIPL